MRGAELQPMWVCALITLEQTSTATHLPLEGDGAGPPREGRLKMNSGPAPDRYSGGPKREDEACPPTTHSVVRRAAYRKAFVKPVSMRLGART